jgi:hypothetical protein
MAESIYIVSLVIVTYKTGDASIWCLNRNDIKMTVFSDVALCGPTEMTGITQMLTAYSYFYFIICVWKIWF